MTDWEAPEELQQAYKVAYERVFTAREVQQSSGLTARQMNDWDERGALPHEREGDSGWRRFTARDIFVLMVCAELRSRFGVSVERIKYVQGFMLQDGADHLEAAIYLMAHLGVAVWLLTDFEETFVMDSELEFTDMWGHGYFGGDHESSFALLKLSPIVNRLLAMRTDSTPIPLHGRGYEIMQEMRAAFGVRTPEEYEALQLIRSGNYERVEIVAPNGKIETLYATARIDPTANLNKIAEEHPYQTLIVRCQDGRTVSVEQTTSHKPSQGHAEQ